MLLEQQVLQHPTLGHEAEQVEVAACMRGVGKGGQQRGRVQHNGGRVQHRVQHRAGKDACPLPASTEQQPIVHSTTKTCRTIFLSLKSFNLNTLPRPPRTEEDVKALILQALNPSKAQSQQAPTSTHSAKKACGPTSEPILTRHSQTPHVPHPHSSCHFAQNLVILPKKTCRPISMSLPSLSLKDATLPPIQGRCS